MKSKAGRPKAVKPLDRMLSVRIESQIAADLELIGRRFGLSLPVVHRQAIIEFVSKNIAAQALTLRAGASEEEPKVDPQGK